MAEFFIRTLAFVRKELFETLRQPRLIALLVLGPFLILLIFGLGYTNENRTLRTLIVVPTDSVIREEIEAFAQRLPGIEVLGLVEREGDADRQLLNGEVDLVIVTPPDPLADILAGERAEVSFQHREIDPIERLYVGSLERAYVNTINREVLTRAVDKGKEELAAAEPALAQALADATTLQSDLEQGDLADATADLQALASDIRLLTSSLGSGMAVFEGIQTLEAEETGRLTEMRSRIDTLQTLIQGLEVEEDINAVLAQQATQVGEIVLNLIRLQVMLETVDSLNPGVVARPFEGRLISLSGVILGPIDFFIPGTIALLLQHIALTLAALSIVRERRGGSLELFRAAPLSASETLLGKSISFFIMSVLLAVVLTALIALVLSTPMEGSWGTYTLAVLLLIFESLALGFLISSISQTDTQAVQYSMIVLLASIFFTGFFIALHRLATPVYLVSALLPATWGTTFLQHIMLRGEQIPVLNLFIPFILGLFYYLIAWWRTRRLLASV
jgi:ABC-2 type transport system permease protein